MKPHQKRKIIYDEIKNLDEEDKEIVD